MARKGGNPELNCVRNTDTRPANDKRTQLANQYAKKTGAMLFVAINEKSGMTYVEYADWLNRKGWKTRRGCKWTAAQVARVFERLGLKKI